MTWLLDGGPTEWTGGEYREAFTLSFEIGDRAYEELRRQIDAHIADIRRRWESL